ncbi:MAG: DUF1697 domain-containing protein [Candidatus Peregrinibacteria bacterium]|nr:DUF1697 domain-containing protein [Candidatus Peregrinibacteria bacterium]
MQKTYIALLRGINIGGNKKVPMQELRELLEGLGYQDVKTVIASGNAVFDSNDSEETTKQKIETAIVEKFGFDVSTQIINFDDILSALKADPFKDVPEKKEIKCNVTFLGRNPTKKEISIENANFQIIDLANNMLFTAVDLSKGSTINLMSFLDKKFGKQVTTRTWKTLERIVNCR